MRFVTDDDVRRVFTAQVAYDSQRAAFEALGSGVADLAPRLILPGTGDDALAFCYAARLRPGSGAVCKFGAVAAGNPARGLPSVHATLLALDPATGVPVAVLDGAALTELRTAAATAVAVNALARNDSSTLAIVGCGVQGGAHLAALTARRSYPRIRLYDHHPGRAAALAATRPELPVTVAPSATAALDGADVVVLATTSASPVVAPQDLAEGVTLVSLGSFAPERCEAPVLAARWLRVVDHAPTALEQAGPIVAAVRSGQLAPEALRELGAVLVGAHTGRSDAREMVYYNSVGLGVQDAAAAWAVLDALG